MSYKHIRSILFRFDSEIVHHLTLCFISFPPVRWILKKIYNLEHDSLKRTVFGITFPNCIGLAAGFDKNAKALLAWQALGFGFVEVGTVTPRAQSGNPRPRILRFPTQNALVNWMGFPNDGIDLVVQRIKKNKSKLTIPIGLNIGKNKDTSLENAHLDYKECIEKADSCVDFFILNISSPNTPGLRELHKPEYLEQLLKAVVDVSQKPILLKISADLQDEALDDVIRAAESNKISGLVVSNTTVDYKLLSEAKLSQGGISGEPLKNKSLQLIKKVKAQTKLPMIGVGGIFSLDDAKAKINSGAYLIELYTGFIFKGPVLIKEIKENMKIDLQNFHTRLYRI